MNTINERFAALPRGRKGTTKVVIVEEGILSKLLADAQGQSAGDHSYPNPGAGTGRGDEAMVIHVDVGTPPPPHADIVRAIEEHRRSVGFRPRGW